MAKNNKIKRILGGVAVACVLSFATVFAGCKTDYPRDPINGKDLNIYDIYAAVKQETGNSNLSFPDFLKEYLSYDSSELKEQASLKAAINRSLLASVSVRAKFNQNTNAYGSGVILDVDRESGDMTVVTNCHVVYSATYAGSNDFYSDGEGYCKDISVWLYGSESLYSETNERNAIPATVVATSKTYDLAVLKISNSSRVKISQAISADWASGEERYVGETVYAVGNANGEMMSANVGYVTKDLEEITVNIGTESSPQYYDYSVIRTSAEILGGNSGGGMFNAYGELIGIVNSHGRGDMKGSGYALTAPSSRRAIARMVEGYAGVPVHGITRVKHGLVTQVTDCYTTGLNEQGVAEKYEEITIDGVAFGKCLGKLERFDIIRHIKVVRGLGESAKVIEDLDINREHNFSDVMTSVQAGDTVYFTVKRKGEVIDPIAVTFSETDFELIA